MQEEWRRRITRAERLAADNRAAAPLLTFYGRVLSWQADLSDRISGPSRQLSGALERDIALLAPAVPDLISLVEKEGPPLLSAAAARFRDSAAAIDEALLSWWHRPSDRDFFSKAILQPYAAALASAQIAPSGRGLIQAGSSCPFCGGAPQLSILSAASSADGGGRQLQCATCFTVWPFRRVLCAQCGEEDEHRLGYYHSPAFDHLRVDACDTCRHYLKTVDLTRLGIAVPVVDEVAGAPLDLWAHEHDYQKIELNLVGL